MTRTGQAAIDYARGRVGGTMWQGSGYCLAFVRECFAVPSYYASAIDAWQAAAYRHPGDANPPAGVPIFFTSSSVYDHVAFYVSKSEVITTWNADIRALPYSQMLSSYGPLLGWSEDLNRVRVWTPPTPIPEPEPEPEDDTVARLLLHPDGTLAMVGPGAAFQVLHNDTQVNTLLATGQVTDDEPIRLENPQIWDTAVDLARSAGLYTK
jgi:hypothetical protein